MLLQLENICVGFPKQPNLISNATISIPKPSIIPLFGKNGSGKSVLLRTIAGITQPTQGRIQIHAEDLSKLTAIQKSAKSAFMTATPPAPNHLSILEIVLTGRQRFISGLNSPSHEDYQAINYALQATGIESIKNQSFAELSDGTKQKVMLARCIAQDSKIILLDEPLAFLDYPTRIEFLKLLQQISRDSEKLILYSSHDITISLEYADAILAIHQQELHFFQEPTAFNKSWLFPETLS